MIGGQNRFFLPATGYDDHDDSHKSECVVRRIRGRKISASFLERGLDEEKHHKFCPSSDYLATHDSSSSMRIAVFDNDGTLWTEMPAYFQLAFVFDRLNISSATPRMERHATLFSGPGGRHETGAAGLDTYEPARVEYRRASMPLREAVMAELAIGAGGTYIHNTNDLQAGLKALISPPEYLYLLEFHARDLKRITQITV